jgi:predicted DCC family thiol-disulfide oxidoreductase YuxK
VSATGQAIILFDGVCNLCSGAVDFIIRRDRAGYFQFAPLQSEAAKKVVAGVRWPVTGLDSIILVENGRTFVRSGAALRIARRLGALWPLLYALVVVPRPLRDAVYDGVARNRYRWFGKRNACRVASPEEAARFLG